MKHLSDDQLQAYLDKDASIDISGFGEPSDFSEDDQQHLAEYKVLYANLASDAGFLLSANFSQTIMEKIIHEKKSKQNFLEIGMMIAVILIAVTAAVYFFNMGDSLSKAFSERSEGVLTIIRNIPFWVARNLRILLAAVLVFILGNH